MISLSELTKEQKEAANYTEGPCKIIAGPGSGKTRTIVMKYLNIFFNKKLDLSKILLLTFSNKATDELKNRVIEYLDNHKIIYKEEDLKIFTIHSFCKKELEENFSLLKEKVYASNLLDEISQGGFVLRFSDEFRFFSSLGECKKVYGELIPFFNKITNENLKFANVYLYLITNIKKCFKRYDENQIDGYETEIVKEIKKSSKLIDLLYLHQEYLSLIKREKVVDFANLQTFFLDELKGNNDFLKKIREKYSYILVDEYQDTSYLQSQIIYQISQPKYKLTVCGDDDQSIYRFRGATVRNFINFENDLDNNKTKIFYLNHNFRSASNIVKCSNKIVESLPFRSINKSITSKNQNDGDVYYTTLYDPRDEANHILKIINFLKKKKNIDYKNQAVLYRSVIYESPSLIELLIKENIPFIVHGANKIETSKIISDLLNIWSYCLGFEETELNEKSLFYNNKNEIIEKCKKIKNDLKLKKIKSNINFFYSLIHVSNFFKNTINNNNNSYLSDLSYLSKLIFELDLSLKKTDPLLVNSILKNAILKGELITDTEDKDAVNIMTIHQAKGLEFTATFLPHMVKKKNPNLIDEVLFDLYHYEIKDPNKVNDVDERRLRYVSFTRAKNWNFISRPTKLYTRNGHLRNFRPETILENLKLKTSSSEEIIKSIRQHKVVNESEKLKETKRQSISYSRLSTYILCPRKFNLQYNYGFATIRNTMLNIGSSSHRCLDNLHKNYLNSKKTKYLDSEIEKIVEDNWIELPGRRRESREYKKKLILNLKNYLNKYLWIFPNIFKSEHHFSFYNKLKNYELTGVVDLMLKNKKSLTIIDFKQSSIEQPEYKDQMILYYYVAQKVTEEIKEFKLWLFSVSDCKHKEIIIKKDDLEKFKTKINSVVQNIIDEKFSPNKGHHCKKCPYYEFCY